jgi:hypothetical protein
MPLYELRHLFICSEASNLFKMENQGTIMRVPWEPRHARETLDLLASIYSSHPTSLFPLQQTKLAVITDW